jgi:hypothetical protein
MLVMPGISSGHGVFVFREGKEHAWQYPCEKKDVAAVLNTHFIHYSRETPADGTNVSRFVPMSELTAKWCEWVNDDVKPIEDIDLSRIDPLKWVFQRKEPHHSINGYTVNGPAIVTANIGASHAYVVIGYTQDGVDVAIQQMLEEIMTDVFGPRVPQDYQDMMMKCRITCPFIALDRTQFLLLLNAGDKTGNTDGTSNSPGLVLGAGGYSFVLSIASQFDAAGGYWFASTFVRDDKIASKLGTKVSPIRCNFEAIPKASYTAVAGANSVVYSRSSI